MVGVYRARRKSLTAMNEATVARFRLLQHHRLHKWHADDVHECSNDEKNLNDATLNIFTVNR